MGKKPQHLAIPSSDPVGREEGESPGRWRTQRKMELILYLLRGEPLDNVFRGSQVFGKQAVRKAKSAHISRSTILPSVAFGDPMNQVSQGKLVP